MKPWREIAVPHSDVLAGTFEQAEFAADISQVHTGKAKSVYQDAKAFFERTFITEGMRLLLTSVMKRLNGIGGDPVIQLQTAFGGGKTHTMLAVYHLASGKYPVNEFQGIETILKAAKVKDIPLSRIAVIDGNNLAPGQSWKRGKTTINTLWGELAFQLGGEAGYALVKEADTTGTSPAKEILKAILEKHAPCVILVDELVSYIRQFNEGQKISGGTYDTNLSFVQALTEAVKLVPNALLLGSLPESEVEAGSKNGIAALKALEKIFGRVQALWKPVATEEAFEIVRRRLFENISDTTERDAVCRAFADSYVSEGSKLPSETQEARYYNRLVQAYPIHPEVFDRLYEDWSSLEGFQRTRGVLKLMAKVIYRLWKSQNQDLMIMPGSLPLDDAETRNELVYHLQTGWDPVLEKDIDGERAETTEIETSETRFGAIHAARRVARTIFLGTAPSAVNAVQNSSRGLTRARILLGSLQPGQQSAVFSDALNRLSDHLHYLNTSGDKAHDNARFWFDTRANLRREMEDRKRRFDDVNELRPKLADVLRRMTGHASLFDGEHIFTPHADVPDDGALRLVVLSPEKAYRKQDPKIAFDEVLEYVKSNGTKPRYRGNRLLFLAPDADSRTRVNDCLRTVLAWKSIVDDVQGSRLNIDHMQEQQAKKELETAEEVLPRAVRECYHWLLCPSQTSASEQPIVEVLKLNTGGSGFGTEVERVCTENEWVITAWSPKHLSYVLKSLYWKDGKTSIRAMTFWEDSNKYLYLARLKDRSVFEKTINKGASTKDFFGIAYSEQDGKYEGFQFGDATIQLDDTLILIEPDAARKYHESHPSSPPKTPEGGKPPVGTPEPPDVPPPGPGMPRSTTFIGSVDVNSTTAKSRLIDIADEVIAQLISDPESTIKISVEIHGEFPKGVSDQIKRAVSENAKMLGFKNTTWE